MKSARVAFAFAVFAAFAACSSDPAAVDPYPSCSNGKYVLDDPSVTPNGFDKLACREFMKAIPNVQTDSAKAPTIIVPLAGAILPGAPIFKFTWTPGQLASLGPSLWQQIMGELVLERTAWAADGGAEGGASTALTSDAYVIIFRSVDPAAEVLRVMTINVEYTPSDTAWAALQAAGKLEVSVYGMHFDGGKIATGPFTQAQPRVFSIGP